MNGKIGKTKIGQAYFQQTVLKVYGKMYSTYVSAHCVMGMHIGLFCI